tara:strand:+ start:7702 stop:7983 length:282 start_codon:yes stop_codon:yes gene_type:complete
MSFDDKMSDAISNIESDRAAINAVLTDAMIYLKQNVENHRSTGQVVAKYFEALQRSNDQLIKILALKERRERTETDVLSADELYDLIGKEEEE